MKKQQGRRERRKRRRRRLSTSRYGRGAQKSQQKPLPSPPEKSQNIDMAGKTFEVTSEFVKADAELGLILGWGIICTEAGEPYFDLQGDHIPDDAMLAAAADFMKHSREAKEMHSGGRVGDIVFAFPMTKEVAQSFGFGVSKTGLLLGMMPDDPGTLERARNGELAGFSIGGFRIDDEEVED